GGDADRGGGEWVHVASHHIARRRHSRRQGGDDGGEQQCYGDVDRGRTVDHADGDVLGCFRAGADGEQRIAEQWSDSGPDGGGDYGDEVCQWSGGDGCRGGGDERGGGEQRRDHGDDDGGERGSGHGSGDQSGRADRELSQCIYLHRGADGEQRSAEQ